MLIGWEVVVVAGCLLIAWDDGSVGGADRCEVFVREGGVVGGGCWPFPFLLCVRLASSACMMRLSGGGIDPRTCRLGAGVRLKSAF